MSTVASGCFSAMRTRQASASDMGGSLYLAVSLASECCSASTEKLTLRSPEARNAMNRREPSRWRESRNAVSACTGSQVINGAGSTLNCVFVHR